MFEEIHRVCPDEAITVEQLSKLQYIRAVIQETLRMKPPVIGAVRTVAKETVLEGVTLPEGTVVMTFTHVSHYNPNHWEHPFEFMPERFLKVRGGNVGN